MKAATLFSGIGAPEVAMPHWDWIWGAEIEPFPSAVLAARHPTTVNLGDVTADDFLQRAERPDVLVFGSPCQSFSVAGKRLGLDDPRGNLALHALRLVGGLRPRWFVFENVLGLLSKADDFDAFLAAVEELGYGYAWATLDAQYFGLAQRRKRVFLVGHADVRRAAAVLFEPHGLCGDPPTRGQAGQDVTHPVAQGLTASGRGVERVGEPRGQDPVVVRPVSHCLNAGGMGRQDYETETMVVTHALRAEGFDASEDGTGRGTPLIAFSAKDSGGDAGPLAPTLRAGGHTTSHANAGVMPAIAYGFANTAGATNLGYEPEQAPPVTTRHGDPGNVVLAFHENQRADTHATLDANNGSRRHNGVAVFLQDDTTPKVQTDMANTLRRDAGGEGACVFTSGVRRLTPTECERLQGFPDDYTQVLYRGKPAADGPRYKAIGNSMAVPVVRWLLRRLEFVDTL